MAKRKHGASIKDPDTYEAMREGGATKEKAARIANSRARGDEPSKKGGASPPYETWTKARLYNRARELGIDGRSKLSKADLIEALRRH
ncbi:MAG: Rho termination factor [Pseudomonadota bacterium]